MVVHVYVVEERRSGRWRFFGGPFYSMEYATGWMDAFCDAGWKRTLRASSRAARFKPRHPRPRYRRHLRWVP